MFPCKILPLVPIEFYFGRGNVLNVQWSAGGQMGSVTTLSILLILTTFSDCSIKVDTYILASIYTVPFTKKGVLKCRVKKK